MKGRIKFQWQTFLAVFFILFIFYLAGSYISKWLFFPFLLFLFLLVFSLLHLIISYSYLRYYQDFSTEHPVKGEGVDYRLSLTNSASLGAAPLRVSFKVIQPGLDYHIENFEVCLKSGERLTREFHIACPYRGVYTVGLESLEFSDLFGWMHLRIPVFYRTFYVYPRILQIEPLFSGGIDGVEHSNEKKEIGAVDYSLFLSLRSYRPGESVRHIAWKKFAALGEPVLQTYDKRTQEGLVLYLDLRRRAAASNDVLSMEDCSIEIATALVYYFLHNYISVQVRAFGETEYSFTGQHPADFGAFYRDTMALYFCDSPSPGFLFDIDNPSGTCTKPGLIITHLVDHELFALVEHHTHMETFFGMILNQSGFTPEDNHKVGAYLASRYEQSHRIIRVRDSENIEEDLNR